MFFIDTVACTIIKRLVYLRLHSGLCIIYDNQHHSCKIREPFEARLQIKILCVHAISEKLL